MFSMNPMYPNAVTIYTPYCTIFAHRHGNGVFVAYGNPCHSLYMYGSRTWIYINPRYPQYRWRLIRGRWIPTCFYQKSETLSHGITSWHALINVFHSYIFVMDFVSIFHRLVVYHQQDLHPALLSLIIFQKVLSEVRLQSDPYHVSVLIAYLVFIWRLVSFRISDLLYIM